MNSPHSRAANVGPTVLAAVCCLAVIFGGLAYLTLDSDAPAERPAGPVADTTPADSPAPAATPAPQPIANDKPLVLSDPTVTPGANPQQAAVAPVKSLSEELSERIAAHVEAGEFHIAIALANQATDARQRQAYLTQIVETQIEAGEFQAALASIRQMDGEHQAAAHADVNSGESLAGGGSFADFTQLIELIQTETSGPWLEIDGDGGTLTPYNTGVRVDPNGLLDRVSREDQSGELARLARQAREADLSSDLATETPLRFISLVRLERAVAERLRQGEPVTASMKYLGGLMRITHVVADTERNDILIGGPAEGWKIDENGLAVGKNSGRPVMQLDDLVTVLRVFSDRGLNIFTCSIVPRQSGLKKLRDFVEASNRRGPLAPGRVGAWADQMEQTLGMQDIVYEGVPTHSRVARVIIEADYKMKLIGIDKLEHAGIPSFFDLLTPQLQKNPPPMDALRWWLTMNYAGVLHSPDKSAFRFEGESVKCLSQNELINELGERVQTGKTDSVNSAFAQAFTSKYAELAQEDTVFADLQNIFDLALVASVVNRHQLATRCNWDRGVFAADGAYNIARHPAPTEVHTVANFRTYRGGNIVAQVAGGVRVNTAAVLGNEATVREDSQLASAQQTAAPSVSVGDRWWWDAR